MANNSQGLVMSNADYRKAEGISSTDLKKIVKSPAHFRYWKDNPEEADTPALLFGRASHKYVLETYDFYKEFAVAPNCDRRTKEGKEMWSNFVADNVGKDIITQEQFEQIDAMRNAMLATPFVSKLINGEHEVSYFWTDEDTGIKCKVRPDAINHKIKVIVDYKTCDNAETQHFMRKAIDLGYDLQAYMYKQGVMANLECDVCGKKHDGYYEYKGRLFCEECLENILRKEYLEHMKEEFEEEYFLVWFNDKITKIPYFDNYLFVFIAQEKKPPYAVNILEADENFMASGKHIFKEMLNLYKECSESGNWYGYLGADNQINSLGVPKWIENLIDTESEE